ncbi:MAG: glycosyltransferase family 2 protein [Candidatus Hydrogenedentes bacterium]|nr:glycosyltransferase family 2 protein [Candidatus Hydrogenedentota bacterium]
MKNLPLVHVLVINWNGLKHLRECFDSLAACTYSNAKFILLDNASEDESAAFVRDTYRNDPRVEILVLPRNLGWSGGNNAGLSRALEYNADYVFLLNNDTVTAPDAIERLVEMAESRPEIGALAPKMLLYDAPGIINSVGLACSIIGGCWDVGLGRLDAPRWNVRRRVAGACGGACFLRVSALRKTGLLPEEFEIYLDDLDLCLRIWNAGYEVWSCPEAAVRHKFSATMGEGERAQRKYYLNTRNRFWLIGRNFPLSHAVPIKLATILGESRALGRAVLDREWWKLGAHAKAWSAAVGYWPQAMAERRRRRREGQRGCRFWGLIELGTLFFPGAEFPLDGWYAERTVRGCRCRPMSHHARLTVTSGSLRVTHMNCYPQLGPTEIQLLQGGSVVATLATRDADTVLLDVEAGTLEFRADRIFDAELTGERVDIGGWIRVEER